METLDELFDKLRTKAAAKRPFPGARGGQGTHPRLLPDRHPVRDFFIADILDWALKDDVHSMEHPMFSLSKKPDIQIRRYSHNGLNVTITPKRQRNGDDLG